MISNRGRADPDSISLSEYLKQYQRQRRNETDPTWRKCLKCPYANFMSGTKVFCPFQTCFRFKEVRQIESDSGI